MEIVFLILGIIVFILTVKAVAAGFTSNPSADRPNAQYLYRRKPSLMSEAEASFYRRLESVVNGRYYIFPQIHLSALLVNQTKGRYWKAAFQRINRTSVDYVLCDKQTMSPVYAVELDDRTHDTPSRRDRDTGVEKMLKGVGLPLLRFRDVASMTDDQIDQVFQAIANKSVQE